MKTSEFETFERVMGENSWGFVNQNGEAVIPLNKYKFLNPIDEEGMILAQSNGKSGYINIKQDTLIPFIYDDLSVFSHGLAPAKKNDKYGFIDRKGKVVIPFKYENESHFYKCRLARAKLNGKYGFIDQSGNEIVPIQFEKVRSNKIDSLVCAMKDGKWAFFSCSGKQLTEFEYDKITESYFDDRNYTYFERGLCRVEKNGKVAYLNKDFKEVVNFGTYDIAEPYRNYLGIVSKKGKYGIIDTLGNVVLPIKYDFIEHPTEYSNESDLFAIKKGKNIQLLDNRGNPITDFDIKEFEWDSYKGKESYHRYFVLTNSSGMVGTVSDKGIREIPFEYEKIEPFDGKPITFAKRNGKFGLIDHKGEVQYPFEFEEIISVSSDDYFIAKKSDKYGIIDFNGKQIVSFSYEHIDPTYNGFLVKKNGLIGKIDIEENVIIPIEYEEISNWVEYGPDEHFVTKNGKKGLISRDGKIVIPTEYDEISVDNSKLIKVANNGVFGTINWKNEIIHPIQYKQILWEWPYLTNKELDTVYLKRNGKYISTDTKGNILEENVSEKLINEKFGYLLNN
ncbi:WG repeat-containing protein [Leeuwenhoekiella sp. MAR_2009_132]|uniref:WG repeat-containing protein n=1 Tax=Leeuwenhoekiella sp. MAR_2009_132 TaxID=1392489 RepID=UPI000F678A5B|nr:WG repeat-containing protein [Leeuwenhoekiella sp. MAR_2009_132]